MPLLESGDCDILSPVRNAIKSDSSGDENGTNMLSLIILFLVLHLVSTLISKLYILLIFDFIMSSLIWYVRNRFFDFSSPMRSHWSHKRFGYELINEIGVTALFTRLSTVHPLIFPIV